MATYYAINAGGNWSSGATWSTTSAKDASRTGGATAPTNADDCIIDDYSGNVTVNTASCVCKTLDCTGHTGTLTFTASQTLTVSGSVTFASGMTVSGTGTLAVNAAGTVTSYGQGTGVNLTLVGTGTITLDTDGTKWGTVTKLATGAQTYTLASDFQCTTMTISNYANVTFAGAYDIDCDYYIQSGYVSIGVSFPAGQTLTITTAMGMSCNTPSVPTQTMKSGTTSSAMYLDYQGTAENMRISGSAFTDVDASASDVPIISFNGGTLTRTVNIYTANATHFPAVADVESGVTYGGIDDDSAARLTGTLSAGSGGGLPILGGSIVR